MSRSVPAIGAGYGNPMAIGSKTSPVSLRSTTSNDVRHVMVLEITPAKAAMEQGYRRTGSMVKK